MARLIRSKRTWFLTAVICLFMLSLVPFRNSVSEQSPGMGAPGNAGDTIMLKKMFDQADLFAKRGKLDSAIMLFMQTGQMYAAMNMKGHYAACLNKVAEQFIMAGMIDQGKAITLQALQSSIEAKNVKEEGGALLNLGSVYAITSGFDSAIQYFKKAESIWKKAKKEKEIYMSEVYINYSYIYGETENLPRAFDNAFMAMDIIKKATGDSADNMVYLYNNLGSLYHKSGDYPKAIACYEKAIAIWVPKYGNGHPIAGALYTNIGDLYWEIGNNVQSSYYLTTARSIIMATQGPNSPMLASVYHNLANVHVRMQEYPQAMPLLREALRLWPLWGNPPTKIALTLNNMGYVFYLQGINDSAFHYYRQGIEVARTISGRNAVLADLYSNLGVMLINSGKYQAAKDTLYHAIQNYEGRNINKHFQLARFYYNLGNLAFDQKDFPLALRYIQKSLIRNVADFNDTNVFHNPSLKNIGEKLTLLYSLVSKAETFAILYYRNPNSNQLAHSAFETAELASHLADSIRAEKSLEDSQWLIDREALPYPLAIEFAYILYHRTGDDTYLEKAFALSEKSKYNSLAKSIRELEARNIGGIPDSLQEFERSIKSKIAHYRKSIRDEKESPVSNKTRISQIEKELFTLNRQADSLKKSFEKNYPQYYQLKYSAWNTSTSDVTKSLGDNDALIEYALTNNYLIAFTFTRNARTITGKLINSQLSKDIDSLRSIILKRDPSEAGVAEYTEMAGKLYSLLVGPVAPLIKGKNLTIIPDGILGTIPFEALVDVKALAGQKNFGSLPYLIKQHQIGYGYSATLFLNSMDIKNKKAGNDQILGFAPSFPVDYSQVAKKIGLRGPGLGPLIYAKDEVKLLQSDFGGIAFIDSSATKHNFMKEAPGFGILHISTHGIINNSRPLESMLIFYQKKESADSNLHVYELFNMNLKANLVVLSACNTGVGTINENEGIMSLSSGFLYSGVNSLIATMWGVNDHATSKIMKTFYQHLFNKEKKPEALRNAQIEYLANADQNFSHPFYWAGFIQIGNNQPLPSFNYLVFALIVGAAITIIAGLIIYKKRKRV